MNVKKPSTLRRILRYVGKYPVSLIGSLLLSLLSVAATLCVPVFFGNAIDCIVGQGHASTDYYNSFPRWGQVLTLHFLPKFIEKAQAVSRLRLF